MNPVDVTRGLLTQAATVRHGYLDVLGESVRSPVPTFAQRAMNSRVVAGVYERVWRPLSFYTASGVTTNSEVRRARRDLHPAGAAKLLDVACGPGNFTRPLSEDLTDGGVAVGLDISEPMLTRAVLDNSGPHICYVRGDARNLPFNDETFDAVCCFGALYLMPEPLRVAQEMVRVLAPSGRIAILTSCSQDFAPIRYATEAAAGVVGLRIFDKHTFVDMFTSAGLVEIHQEIQRSLQYVTAAKPANAAR
ncbi:MAG TPA: methyltransferase domain-containing protein [Acidothermaceae bacterium]|nr:methyltransferase domain-containing protein [Acidothermaceae bacterium]